MTHEVAMTLYGSCIGVGLVVGGLVAIFNSWMP